MLALGHLRAGQQSSSFKMRVNLPAIVGYPRTGMPRSARRSRSGSWHPEGLVGLAAFWPPNDAQRCQLLRTSE